MAIEEKSLKKILDGILKTDMIVETGEATTIPTVGPTTPVNWKWKKYTDGTIDCWGSTLTTYNFNSGPIGSSYYTSITWPLPENLFYGVPFAGTVSRFGNGGNGLIDASVYAVTDSYITMFIYYPGSTYNNTIGFSVHITGQWATVDPSSSTLNITGFSQNQMSKAEIRALIEASGNIFVDNTNWVPSDLQ